STVHIETVKKLNEKLYDLSEENRSLKDKIDDLLRSRELKDEILLKTDKENVFTNNYTKVERNCKTLMDNVDTSYNNYLAENYKTLEQRVNELEKGLRKSNN